MDYNKTFATIIKLISYKALFALAALKDLKIKQIDIKIAFLYSSINEEIYME